MTLERELETFSQQLPELLADNSKRGKYVLIHGSQVSGVWPTIDAALEAGYREFNLQPFLVKQVIDRELPQYFSRNLKRCPS